jgi:glutamyl-tRNA reductase
VEPAVSELQGCYVYDIDDLQQITEEHLQQRQAVVAKGEDLVRARLSEYRHDCARRAAGPTIAAFRRHLGEILRGECAWAIPKLKNADEADRKVIEQMIHRAVNKVLHCPTKVLNDQAGQGHGGGDADALKRLFELADED